MNKLREGSTQDDVLLSFVDGQVKGRRSFGVVGSNRNDSVVPGRVRFFERIQRLLEKIPEKVKSRT